MDWTAFAIAVFGIIGALLILGGVALFRAAVVGLQRRTGAWTDWAIVAVVLLGGIVLVAGAIGVAA